MAERQILQFVAHALHAHAPGERRIDVERLLGDPRVLLRRHEMQSAHIVQTVGEFDEQNAHIVGDGEQQLAKILRLHGAFGDEIKPFELGQAFDEPADVGPEKLVDFLAGRIRIFDRVMQNSRDNGRVIELEVGQDGGDFERMREIRIAGGAFLRAMRFHRIDIGAIKQVFVGMRIVPPNAIDELILPHHGSFRCHANLRGSKDTRGRATSSAVQDLERWLPQPPASTVPAPAPRQTQSLSSSVSAGGTSPSRPRSKSSSVIRSNWTSPNASDCALSIGASAGTASASGSSTSTCFCSE